MVSVSFFNPFLFQQSINANAEDIAREAYKLRMSSSSSSGPPTYRGRAFGIAFLSALQILSGFIHIFFGLWLFSATPPADPFPVFSPSRFTSDIYAMYTILFGVMSLVFGYGLWLQKRWGWVGTAAVCLFVIAADTLALFDLPSVPGIPKVAAFGEIPYSVLVAFYLSQGDVRSRYGIRTS